MRLAIAILLSIAAFAASQTGTSDLKPYEVVWRADSGVLADVSFLLDKPAGTKGFVQIKNGHLADGAGKRLRIWGVNSSFTSSTPSKEVAHDVAAHLARFGVNCIRVHHLDWRAPRGIIDSTQRDSRHLDPVLLDRLDYFIAELKKQGVYVNLNLNVARSFQAGDGVKDSDQLGFAKSVTIFDPRIIELEKEYARTILTHRNPYTNTEYRSEPAVAMVELINENSLIESWIAGRLQGRGRDPKQQDATWTDIPPSYAQDLTRMYNDYLAKHVPAAQLSKLREESGAAPGSFVPRLAPAQFANASPLRFQTEAAFYMSLENEFFQNMYSYLKQDLGIRVPVVATSIHNGGITPYPLLSSTVKLDIVDAHTYWQHPKFLSDPVSGRRTGFEIPNTPAVNNPERSSVLNLARVAVAGKPFMVSEVNHPYPNEYGSEGIPLIAAYGAFQDWDAVFWYSFSHQPAEQWSTPSLPNHFDIRQDPVKMTEWASAALMFQTGAIQPASQTVDRSYTPETVAESLRLSASEGPFFTPGFPSLLTLEHAVRVRNMPASEPPAHYPMPSTPYVSDTRQLAWYLNGEKKGLVIANSDRWQALIGYVKTQSASPSNLKADISNDFAAITLASLDSKPIRSAQRLLLTTGGRVANAGMRWNEKRTGTIDDGRPGMLIEPIAGTLTLKGLSGAKSVELQPLDGAGRAQGPAAQAVKSGQDWTLLIGQTVTPWYLIRVTR
jgi:hypothetical protein